MTRNHYSSNSNVLNFNVLLRKKILGISETNLNQCFQKLCYTKKVTKLLSFYITNNIFVANGKLFMSTLWLVF